MKKTILCVDDEKIILDSLKSQLKRRFANRFNYETAVNASEALEVIEEMEGQNIIIIVSDWLMPGINGDVFLIKVHKEYPQILKIMLTGQADQDSIDNAFHNANLYKCLKKPWDEEELFAALEGALEETNNA